jgi:hypothetical protein
MKLVFVVGGAIALVADLVSYYTKIDSFQLLEAAIAIGGITLVILGVIQKKERAWTVQPQPQPVYQAMAKAPVPVSEPKADTGRILRTVPDENAFYFYKMLHYYLDVKAKNLVEFFEKLKTIDADSIAFHVSRGDFREWFRTTLGDADLAGQVSTLGEKKVSGSGEELRTKITNIVQTRLTEMVERKPPSLGGG